MNRSKILSLLRNPTLLNRSDAEYYFKDLNLIEMTYALCQIHLHKYHGDQELKGYGSYIEHHLRPVVRIVHDYTGGMTLYDRAVTLLAAWLHDIVEDTEATPSLVRQYGPDVAHLVYCLTKGSTTRITNDKLISSIPSVAIIKLADIERNCRTIGKSKSKEKVRDWATKKLLQLTYFVEPNPDQYDQVQRLLNSLIEEAGE